MSTPAANVANASTNFQLLANPHNPSPAEVAAAVKLVRAGGITHPQKAKAHRVASTPSLTPSAPRDVALEIFGPPHLDANTPRPVVLKWHGSGYVVPRLGADADVNQWLVEELNVTVVDADYVKAPEFPFPEPLYDVVAAFKWTLAQPWFNRQMVVMGHSAGAQFALALSSRSVAKSIGITDEEYDKVKASVSLYPPIDASIPITEKATNEQGELPGIPMAPLSREIMDFFFGALLGWDKETQLKNARDPRVSPGQAPIESYEVPCYIIACEHDPLGKEETDFAHKLMQHNPKHAFYFAKGVGHSYETRIPDIRDNNVLNVPGGQAKIESFTKILDFIKKNVPAAAKP